MDNQLAEWQHYYNWLRPHSAHNGKTPIEKYFELCNKIPFSNEVWKDYDVDKEWIQDANYKRELEIARLKRSL